MTISKEIKEIAETIIQLQSMEAELMKSNPISNQYSYELKGLSKVCKIMNIQMEVLEEMMRIQLENK